MSEPFLFPPQVRAGKAGTVVDVEVSGSTLRLWHPGKRLLGGELASVSIDGGSEESFFTALDAAVLVAARVLDRQALREKTIQ